MLSRRISTLNDETIVLDKLIGYWNSKTGINGTTWENVAPNTVGKYNGTVVNTVTSQSSGMNFNGSGYISFNSSFVSDLPSSNPFTIEFWSTLTSSTITALFGNIETNNHYLNARTLQFYSGGFLASLSTPLATNVLNHVVLTFDGRTVFAYVNGVLGYSTEIIRNIATFFNDKKSLGAYVSSSGTLSYYRGILPVFRLYSKALSESEIAKNYAMGTKMGL